MTKAAALKESVPSLRRIGQRFWPLIRKQRKLITISMFAMFAEIALRLAEPWPIKFVFDHVLVFGRGDTPADPSTSLSPMTILAFAAASLVAIAALRAFSGYARRVGFALAGSRVLMHCRSELFAQLQRLSLSFHSKARTGDLITRVTGDIGRVKEVTITAAMPLVAHVITLVAMVVVMLIMDWQLGLIALSILPLFYLATRRIGRRIRAVARVQRQRKGEMGATATEAIGSIRTVQTLGIEDVHHETFAARNKADMREGVKAKRLSARLIGTADVLIAIGTGLVLWFGTQRVLSGELLPGDLIVFLAYLKSSLRPIRNLAKYSGRIAKAAASAERILEILDMTPQIQSRPGAIDLPPVVETLRFDDVTFGYEEGHTAVNEVSFDLRPGEILTLAGPSGAGKSTIISLLLRLYDPWTGAVTINGQPLDGFRVESLRRAIAVVPQENVLFAVSARDNIAYGAPDATEDEIIAAAKLARAHKFIERLPNGYDTMLGERGDTLSEGQRQRIAIARAAVRRSPIIVLDEPTSSLDNENNRAIRSALDELSRDRICIIVAHDLSTVPESSKVLFLDRGRAVERGRHDELLQGDSRYAAMHALRAPTERPHAVSG